MYQTGGGQGAPPGLVGHQMPSDRTQIAVVEVFGGGCDRGGGCWVMCQSYVSAIRAASPLTNSVSTSAPPHYPSLALTHRSSRRWPYIASSERSHNAPPITGLQGPSSRELCTGRRPALPWQSRASFLLVGDSVYQAAGHLQANSSHTHGCLQMTSRNFILATLLVIRLLST